MSDDWKPGDLALCVRGGRRSRCGSVYTVDEVCLPGAIVEFDFINTTAVPQLRFSELRPFRPGYWCDFDRFRKIHPLTDKERDEFRADLDSDERVSDFVDAMLPRKETAA